MLVSRTYFTAAQEPGGLSVARRQRTGLRSPRRSPLPNDPAREMRRQLTLWVSDRPVGVRLCRARGGSATGQDYAIYLGTLSIASTLAEVKAACDGAKTAGLLSELSALQLPAEWSSVATS